MGKNCIARETLEKAKYFLEQAELSGTTDIKSFKYNLEAAIVFGRSVTFHIQKEFSAKSGFNAWYSRIQNSMKDDPLSKYFLTKRNYILKEGSVGIRKTISVSITIHFAVESNVEEKIIRGKPWYMRNIMTLWRDLRDHVFQPIRKWRRHQESYRARLEQRQKNSEEHKDFLHFDEPMWKDRPATELLKDYLNKLEAVVDEAEVLYS